MKAFMRKVKSNPDTLESSSLHNGVPVRTGKAQTAKPDLNAQKRALKIRQKAQNHD